jgi:hypothetical protein
MTGDLAVGVYSNPEGRPWIAPDFVAAQSEAIYQAARRCAPARGPVYVVEAIYRDGRWHNGRVVMVAHPNGRRDYPLADAARMARLARGLPSATSGAEG